MIELIIKQKYGYTLDKSKLCHDRCPDCGGFVYRTKEDPMMCFCTNVFCSFHDRAAWEWDEMTPRQKKHYREFDEAFEYARALYLKDNDNYPSYSRCVIRKSDVAQKKYIVREWEPGDGKYLDSMYDSASRIIRQYSSLEQLVKDEWALD